MAAGHLGAAFPTSNGPIFKGCCKLDNAIHQWIWGRFHT